MYKRRKDCESFKIAFKSLLSVKVVTVLLFALSLPLNIYLSFGKDVFNLVATKIQLQNELNEVNSEINVLRDENEELRVNMTKLENEKQRLERKLGFYMVTVNGYVNTSGWERWDLWGWDSPTWAISITFSSGGTKHITSITEGTYGISLQNNQTYSVTVQWENQAGTRGDADWEGTLELNEFQEEKERDWDLSK